MSDGVGSSTRGHANLDLDHTIDIYGPPLHVHLIAVGGAAMSASAIILARLGHRVTGSDQADSAVLEQLRTEGISVWVGHDAKQVEGADLIAISAAIKPGNVELDAARANGQTVWSRADLMEAIGRGRRTVAISGTHGKTTTSAMTTLIFDAAGRNPSFIVGGQVRALGGGVRWTDSAWFCVEADESDGSFLRFHAEAVVVTNIEADHLDFHGSMDRLELAFDEFVSSAPGPKVLCGDDPGIVRLLERVGRVDGVCTYGFARTNDVRIESYEALGLLSRFEIVLVDGRRIKVSLRVAGAHNVANAVGALTVAVLLGVEPTVAAQALEEFGGVGRRFEHRGSAGGVTFVDDYAHLPTEVAAMVSVGKAGQWSRLVAVFQPHRYTRIADVGADFAHSFVGADMVVVTGIYGAGQEPIPGVSGRTVVDAVTEEHPELDIRYCETRDELVALLVDELRDGDLCLTMNAGDLTTLPDELLAHQRFSGSRT